MDKEFITRPSAAARANKLAVDLYSPMQSFSQDCLVLIAMSANVGPMLCILPMSMRSVCTTQQGVMPGDVLFKGGACMPTSTNCYAEPAY